MTRIAPIRTPTPAHRVPSTRKVNPLQRIKDIAKSVPWLAAPPMFVLSIVVMAVGKVHEHEALMLLLREHGLRRAHSGRPQHHPESHHRPPCTHRPPSRAAHVRLAGDERRPRRVLLRDACR